MTTESQTDVYETDVADLSDEVRMTVTEADQVVTVKEIWTSRTVTLINGEKVIVRHFNS